MFLNYPKASFHGGFSMVGRLVIFVLTLIVTFSQIAWCVPAVISQQEDSNYQPVSDPFALTNSSPNNQIVPADPIAAGPPLSPPTALPVWSTGSVIEVHEGDSVQIAINGAQAGDLIFLYNGNYHGHFILKDGVSIMGESRDGTILNGDGLAGEHVIRAMGNNRIENLTITGSAAYSGASSSAIRVEGDYVKIRNNNIVNNLGYGLYAWNSSGNILVEGNLIKNNNVGIQLPKDSNIIRFNTLIDNNIGINILNGEKPRIENNIITGSKFSAIYEFSWNHYAAGEPSRGYAIVENNIFYDNVWRATAYGPSIPPAAQNSTVGNSTANPEFTSPSAGDYSVAENSPAYGHGAFLPQALENALNRATQFNILNTITPILTANVLIGWQITYAGGSVEQFNLDGTQILDTTGPVIQLNGDSPTNNLGVNPFLS